MTHDLLIEYAQMLKNKFKSAKLVNYFLAIMQSDAEVKKMMKYINDFPDATPTDHDEYVVQIRFYFNF